jgi:O-antigen/teichoic acid export membrane protein
MNQIKKYLSQYIGGEKDQQVIKNMVGAFAIKGAALFISVFTMPAYIRYFDNQIVLGLWFTVLSVMIWLLSFDFGIGNGLRNKLVRAIVEGDKQEIKTYISSAYIITAGIVVITTFWGLVISHFVDWNLFFNIDKSLVTEEVMLFTVRCIFIGVMLQFLLRLISSILYAMQKSALTNLLVLITSIAQLLFILLVPTYDIETNLKLLSLSYVVFINAPLFVVSIIVFQTELKDCAPNMKYFNKIKAISVLTLGGVFFWNQIMYMIIAVTNEFFITRFAGPGYVVEYQIYNKLFTLVGSLFMLALTPLWSAITKALTEKDAAWLEKTYKILNYMVVLAVGSELLMIPFLQFIINIWLGGSAVTVNYLFAVVFALYGSVFIYQSVLSTIVCGMGKMKLQASCYTAAVICKFVIVYFGMRIYDSWIVVILANLLILLPYCILQPRYIKRDIYNLKSGGIEDV